MTLEHYIGITIRGRRKELGLSQAELSALAGITDTTLSNIEKGQYGGRFYTIAILFGCLNLDLNLISDLVFEMLRNDERYQAEKLHLLHRKPNLKLPLTDNNSAK